eukprot:3376513-Rhodomonas_salina.1
MDLAWTSRARASRYHDHRMVRGLCTERKLLISKHSALADLERGAGERSGRHAATGSGRQGGPPSLSDPADARTFASERATFDRGCSELRDLEHERGRLSTEAARSCVT